MVLDPLGHLLRASQSIRFPKKGQLIEFWLSHRKFETRLRILPGRGRVVCDLAIPYEAMVWLQQEEERDLKVLQKLLKGNQTFVDCGANIGLWSMVAAAVVGEKGAVYAFEPNSATVIKLKHNIALNQFQNVTIIESAVGSSAGRALLEVQEDHNRSRIVSTPSQNAASVPVTTLDSALRDKTVHGLKLDVEGHELDALFGAENILKTFKPWLCVEFNTILSEQERLGSWPVHQYLTELGYWARPFAAALSTRTKSALPDDFHMGGYANLFYCQ